MGSMLERPPKTGRLKRNVETPLKSVVVAQILVVLDSSTSLSATHFLLVGHGEIHDDWVPKK